MTARKSTSTLRCPTEAAEQVALARWLDARRLLWCHAPNETHASVGYLRKRATLGVKAGVPDVLIFTPPPACPTVRGVAIELKRQRGGTVSARQTEWLDGLHAAGWVAEVCKGAAAAINLLQGLGY